MRRIKKMKGINSSLPVKVRKMKKIGLCVEFVGPNEEVTFAVLFVGVMTRYNIYAKRISSIDSRPDEDYIKIKKEDVVLEQNIKSVYDCLGITHYSISVPEELGLNDPRIISTVTTEDIISEIDSLVTECNEINKKISS